MDPGSDPPEPGLKSVRRSPRQSQGEGKQRGGGLEELKRRGRQERSREEQQEEQQEEQEEEQQEELSKQLQALEVSGSAPRGTGLVYSETFLLHQNLWEPSHPESPHRVTSIMEELQRQQLLELCVRVEPREATQEELLFAHESDYLELLSSTQTMKQEELLSLSSRYDSVYLHPASFQVCVLAVGSVLQLVDAVLTSQLRNGFAIIRPPGHHAQTGKPNGFCLLNNVGVAARYAQRRHGISRVLIVDWDVHHGQGVQYLFQDDPSVLYFSLHRYQQGSFWPHLPESDSSWVGSGGAEGRNINLPWNQTGMTDADYIAAFQQLLLPVAYQFQPQLVLVSAGFDAAAGDPKGEMCVSPQGFQLLTHMLMSLAGGRLVLALEGGYNLQATAEGAAACVRALLGGACPPLAPPTTPSDSALQSISQTVAALRPHWTCLQGLDGVPLAASSADGVPLAASSADGVPLAASSADGVPLAASSTDGVPLAASSTDSVPLAASSADGVPLAASSTDTVPLAASSTDSVPLVNSEVDGATANQDSAVRVRDAGSVSVTTGLVYDERMMEHENMWDRRHPEQPQRIRQVFSRLQLLGLAEACQPIPARLATEEELALCHSMQHIHQMKATAAMKPRELHKLGEEFNSIFINKHSFQSARLAAGGCFNAVDRILSGQVRNGVAVVRPPGHHAETDSPCGFCFFNTAALCARYAQKNSCNPLLRVLILDWDVHHGNGTQHMFEEDSSILYISLHRYDNGAFFPSSEDAAPDKVGVAKGAGYNVNVAWSGARMGDPEYLAAFHHVVMPIATEFAPELVLVSAGFDAARGDPLGGYHVTPEGYAHLTHMLMALAGGRVLLILEGGYNLTSISDSMAMCTSTLRGDPPPPLAAPLPPPHRRATAVINEVIRHHAPYWRSLRIQVPDPVRASLKHAGKRSSKGKGRKSDRSRTDPPSNQAKPSVEQLTQGLAGLDISQTAASQPPSSTVVGGARPKSHRGSEGVEPEKVEPERAGPGSSQPAESDPPQLHLVHPLTWCPHLDAAKPPPPLRHQRPPAVSGLRIRGRELDLPQLLPGVLRPVCEPAHGYPRHCGPAPSGPELLRPVGMVLPV
ncbi:histone deacetylase 6 isoform 2-T2 [Menidia menidia]